MRDGAPLDARAGNARPHRELMPASFVKAYVKRSKNDAADAARIASSVLAKGETYRAPALAAAGQEARQ